MVGAGGDKDPPTTTTGATSAAALTTMNNIPDTQQHTKGERRKLLGFLEIFLESQTDCFNLDLDLTNAEKSNLT